MDKKETILNALTSEWMPTQKVAKTSKVNYYVAFAILNELLSQSRIERMTLGRINYWKK